MKKRLIGLILCAELLFSVRSTACSDTLSKLEAKPIRLSEAGARMALKAIEEAKMLNGVVALKDSIIRNYQLDGERKTKTILNSAHELQAAQNKTATLATSLESAKRKLLWSRLENWAWRGAVLLIAAKKIGLW
ncbi:hypothetical protein [Runella sp.]|uniref:hypothetical protein n=1 Tax=Runella sp. TaxID=1960881 RepID=UPI003D14BFD0